MTAPYSELARVETSSQPVIYTKDLWKIYGTGHGLVQALRGIDLKVMPGEFVSIMGQSGSGKSTLLHVLGCLHKPTSGDFFLDGENVATMTDSMLASLRNRKIGFIFQKFNLLPIDSIVDNVALPLLYGKVTLDERVARATSMLNAVGLGNRLLHNPTELSGGQMQRVAIARALVTHPALLLADEPTGNLDSHTGLEIMGLFQALNARGATIVQVTHDPEKAEYGHRIVKLADGVVVSDAPVEKPIQAPTVSLGDEAWK
ncbi:MAG TPA: ABC transporter ATP-binding protein [Planctomycetota bacterium]|nr:ABC transporter ATP-binding protein [Planctomycetota bacterium]